MFNLNCKHHPWERLIVFRLVLRTLSKNRIYTHELRKYLKMRYISYKSNIWHTGQVRVLELTKTHKLRVFWNWLSTHSHQMIVGVTERVRKFISFEELSENTHRNFKKHLLFRTEPSNCQVKWRTDTTLNNAE